LTIIDVTVKGALWMAHGAATFNVETLVASGV